MREGMKGMTDNLKTAESGIRNPGGRLNFLKNLSRGDHQHIESVKCTLVTCSEWFLKELLLIIHKKITCCSIRCFNIPHCSSPMLENIKQTNKQIQKQKTTGEHVTINWTIYKNKRLNDVTQLTRIVLHASQQGLQDSARINKAPTVEYKGKWGICVSWRRDS